MKNVILSIVFLSCIAPAYAQTASGRESKREQIEAQKVAYITSELKLTPEEAQRFWPLYNAYQDELNKQRREGKKIEDKLRDESHVLSDPELDALMKDRFAKERAKIDLDEKYYHKYKKVLSADKLAAYYRAERSFKRELLDRLREKPGGARPRN